MEFKMKEKLVAPCGLNCAICDTFLATQADNDDLRQQVADKWSALFHYTFHKDDINCDGCLSGGRMSIYCGTMCEIKPCAISKGLVDCKDCPDYLCDKLRKNLEASSHYTND